MKRFVFKLLSALSLLLICGAVVLLVGFFSMQTQPLHWALWPVLAVVLATAAGAFSKHSPVLAGIGGIAVLLGCAALWYPPHTPIFTLLLSVVLFWVVWRAWPRPPFDEWPQIVIIGGAGLYVAGYLFARIVGVPPLSPLFLQGLLVYAPVLLLLYNHVALLDSASARDGRLPPRRMQMANLLLAAAVAVVTVILMNIQAIGRAFYAAGNWLLFMIFQIVMWFMRLFPSELADEPMTQSAGGFERLPPPKVSEPSFLSQLLQKVMDVVVTVVLIALLLVMAYQIFRLVRKAVRWIIRHLREAMHQLGEGVQDKTESILDWEELRMEARQRMDSMRKRLRRPPRWETLDSRQRVRRLFARWRGQQGGKPDTATAREVLTSAKVDEAAAALYEKARYSSLPVDEGDVQAMQRLLERED